MSVFSHQPVMLKEVIHYLALNKGHRILDCTVGGAGHSAAILQSIGKTGFLWGLDRDQQALAAARDCLQEVGHSFQLIHGNFAELDTQADIYGMKQLDGILFDLGTSSFQLTNSNRGFTFMQEAPLDMRMDQRASIPTAYDLVNTLSEIELADIIYKYGEEPSSRAIARRIVQNRRQKPIETTTELAKLVIPINGKRAKTHPATRTFQALRIAVNQELSAIEMALEKALVLLKPGGRLVAISFHSLEARGVKQFFQMMAKSCLCPPKQPICTCQHQKRANILTKKAIRPSQEEIKQNPRARSAQLRAIEKL